MTFRINGLGNKSIKFKGRTKINKITPAPVVIIPTASVTPNTPMSFAEGSTVGFNITSNQPSTILFWKLKQISGTINSLDFSGGATSGSFSTNGSGEASISLTILDDGIAEGSESFQFEVKTGSVDGTVIGTSSIITIEDPAPTYSITPSSTSISELFGSCVFTVNTTNVVNGTTLFYGISGTNITSNDFTDNTLTGSFTISGNTGSFTKTIQSDTTFEGDETFTATVRTTLNGTIVATSSAITIVDAAYAASFNGSSQALAVTNNGNFATNGSNYTIEFFLKSTNSTQRTVFSLWSSGSSFEATYSFTNSSSANFQYNLFAANSMFANKSGPSVAGPGLGGWTHVAMCFSSSELRIYFDGTLVNSHASANWGDLSELITANGVNFLGIGGRTTDGSTVTNPKNCSISNFRWVTGSALYTGASITVPSVPLTAVTGTKVLLLNGQSSSVASDTNTILTPKTVTNIGSVPKIAGP